MLFAGNSVNPIVIEHDPSHSSMHPNSLNHVVVMFVCVLEVSDSNLGLGTNLPDGFTGVLVQYLLTPWSRVLLEKLTGLQLVKFPEFYGTRRFITAFTSARHLSLS